jgi:GDPmannose 4,6-dehydratase
MNTKHSTDTASHRNALVCGLGGQDEACLPEFLLSKGYVVLGTSRDADMLNREDLHRLGIADRVRIVSMASNDYCSVLQTITRSGANEIYNLAGQTSVGLSFEQPVEAIESIALGTLNLLESIQIVGQPIRMYNAGSSEYFGDTDTTPANEDTPFRPCSSYAVTKVCANSLIDNYRDAYNLFCCTGILLNHESSLRPDRFAAQRIVQAAARPAAGSAERLQLGNLDIYRDWGWEPEYVQEMWRMLQQQATTDFVIASGQTASLSYFIEQAFGHFNLDWSNHVRTDDSLLGPSDIAFGAADPS